MSTKRPLVDLAALTAEAATPMPEARQRAPQLPAITDDRLSPEHMPRKKKAVAVRTENLEALAFKVSPVFRKRFRQRAVNADLKLNELLFEALDAWEEKRGIKK
jgi:hypothetical protein